MPFVGPLGAEAGARGPAPRGAQGARGRPAQGDPRRATRSARRPRWPTPPGTSTAGRATRTSSGHGADRRRPARHVQQRLGRPGRAGVLERDPARARSSTTSLGLGHPRDRRDLRRGRGPVRAQAAVGAERASAQPAGPGASSSRPCRATNEAMLGYAFDKETSPKGFELIRINAGAPGHHRAIPRPWADGELTPIQRFAGAFAAESPNATEWYFPRRLRLDVDAVSSLRQTKVSQAAGAARDARVGDRHPAVRVPDRPHARPRDPRRQAPAQARRGITTYRLALEHQPEPPRPAGGGAVAQLVPEDASCGS